jgi:quercetin dioxygenase-like cupin family protein
MGKLYVSMNKIPWTNASGLGGVRQQIVYADNVMIQKVEVLNPTYLPFHRHIETQISFVINGVMEISVDKGTGQFEKFRCSSGDVFYIPPNALHDAKILSPDGASWLSFYSPLRISYKKYAYKLG